VLQVRVGDHGRGVVAVVLEGVGIGAGRHQPSNENEVSIREGEFAELLVALPRQPGLKDNCPIAWPHRLLAAPNEGLNR